MLCLNRGLTACRSALVLLAFLIAPHHSHAQSADTAPLVSDRPDFTESPVVVPAGTIQLEMGVTHERARSIETTSIGEGLLRLSLTPRIEARLGLPSLQANGSSKLTDTSIGAKLELPSGRGAYRFGVIGTASLPTGQTPLSADTVVPSVIIATGGPLAGATSLGAQVMVSLPERAGSRVVASGATVVVAAPVRDGIGVFAELAGESMEFEDLSLVTHTGITYALDANLQLDIHIGSAVTDDAPDVFIGFGLVYRR